MWRLWFFLIATPLSGEAQAVDCLGPEEGAQAFAVYLHGMDRPELSQQERWNRAVLARVADELKIRIALPRAIEVCPDSPEQLCWGWRFTDDEVTSTMEQALKARSECYSEDVPFGMMGFSNGGYLLTRWFRSGSRVSAAPTWLIAAGASLGEVPEGFSSEGRPSLAFVTGARDQWNYDRGFFQELEAAGTPVAWFEHPGGHSLEPSSLEAAFDWVFSDHR